MINRLSTFTVVAAVGALVLAGCDGSDPPARSEPGQPTNSQPATAPSTTAKPVTVEEKAKADALAAYEGFWEINAQAGRDPDRNWKSKLEEFVADPALTQLVAELDNAARVPFHYEGDATRSPKVTEVKTKKGVKQPHTVIIMDCLDTSELKMISDRAKDRGKEIPKHEAQLDRVVYEARLAWYPNGDPKRWRVYMLDGKNEEGKSC